jgi:hypothetical protein
MGSRLGVEKVAAKKCGLTLEEYRLKTASGLKRCTFCEEWISVEKFNADKSRSDGLTAGCSECRNARSRETYTPIERLFDLAPGPARIARRSGDKLQARSRINHDVERGLRPNPNDLHCSKCGHKGEDRRHEYHHVMGYDEAHHYDVLPLCTTCHAGEEHGR